MLETYRALIRHIGGTPWFAWLGIHVMTRLDRWLYPRFRGRLVSAGPAIFPVLQLTTSGRISGQPRQTTLIFHPDGRDLIVVASNWGQPHHPAWSTNLLMEPRAVVDVKGCRQTVHARLASAVDKARLWPTLVTAFPPYQAFARRSGRELRVFILTPVTAGETPSPPTTGRECPADGDRNSQRAYASRH